MVRLDDGCEQEVPQAHMGAEWRYQDYVWLRIMEREWKRTLDDADQYLDLAESSRPSPRAVVIIVFWSYFETRIERLLWDSMNGLPLPIATDLLTRYAVIGARIDRLYRVLFSSTYWQDLTEAGFGDVTSLLQKVQIARNSFAHGNPAAISDSLVKELVDLLEREHEGWIAVFNKRATRLEYWKANRWRPI